MKKIRVEDAVGHVLPHDFTKIVPGQFKGARFKKGHVVREEDIPELLSMGKRHIYVLEMGPEQVHEEEAAQRLARAAAGPGVEVREAGEGKVNLLAARDGLLKIRTEGIDLFNSVDQVVLAVRHGDVFVKKGALLGGTRVIPLVVDEERVLEAEGVGRENQWLVEVKPLLPLRVGLITTGSEVLCGRIEDKFGPVVRRKVQALGGEVHRQTLSGDEPEMISREIKAMAEEGSDLVIITGGMSVDPDDQTPGAIKASGARVVTYGAPVLPGSMFMLAYLDDVPVIGLPGCVMYEKSTVFDLILPRLMAGERPGKADIIKLGVGGLCLQCPVCTFPDCSFGKR